MRAALDELRSEPDFARLIPCFRQPLAFYEWELAGLTTGEWRDPPTAIDDPDENRAFMIAAAALAAWSKGGTEAYARIIPASGNWAFAYWSRSQAWSWEAIIPCSFPISCRKSLSKLLRKRGNRSISIINQA